MKALIEVIEKTIRYHQKLLRTKDNPSVVDCPMCIFYKKVSALLNDCDSCIFNVDKEKPVGCYPMILHHCNGDEKSIILVLKKLLVVAKQPEMSESKLRRYVKNANSHPKKYFKF